MLNQMIVSALANPLCEIPLTVAHFFEEQKKAILTTTPIPPTTAPTTPKVFVLKFGESLGSLTTTSTQAPVENENAFYETSDEVPDEDLAAKFAADLCAADRIDENDGATLELATLRPVSKRSVNEQPRFNPKLAEALWAPDLTLMYSPNFTEKSVIFGLDGGIVFFGQKAKNVSRPRNLDVSGLGDKMFGLMISEYVPNTFLTHIYENDFGNFHEVFKTHNLPKFVKPIAKVLCRTCELHMFANLTSRPNMVIEPSGVKMTIDGDVTIKFIGRWKSYNLISADTQLSVVVRPYVRYSRVYGDVGLGKLDIHMKNMGIRGVFANSLKKALNAVIPNKLWPKIKKRLRFALSQRGIRLPIMCGVELERPSLQCADHAIVINTDFRYDLPRFVRKFRAYIRAEVEKKKKTIDSYEDDSE
ncbi:unnamed protein product [Enterobius vermicularis]|uniref:BPI2 domain-containing protein n=1 Tax=Enterobius vermicularis TaxID=51028 RepID=A0A0N4VHZ3_ENTVE|nr:unnamed protein product [Enterobius vermicularis]